MEGQQPFTIAEASAPTQYVVYKIRWLMLGIFVSLSMCNAFQWIEYSIIPQIIIDYYGVEATTVNWLSMLYMTTYIPLVFPGTWFLQKYGLRKSLLIGSCGNLIGCAVKCFSVDPDLFWVTFAGQVITSSSQIFILGIPAQLAATWFGPNQVSTACAIGVFGNQFGIALGFLVPPALVSVDDPEPGLRIMFYTITAIAAILFILIIFIFKEKPKTPPSSAAEIGGDADEGSYLDSVVRLFKNKNFVLLLFSYGMNTGAYYALSTLLGQIFIDHFPGKEVHSGAIGFVLVVSGMCGSVVCGLILDKTGKFKLVTLIIYILSLIFMIVYTFVWQVEAIWLMYVVAALLGAFMTGYLPVGFEFAAELTYPESEGTSSALLNTAAMIVGTTCTLSQGEMLKKYVDIYANLLLVAALGVGTVLTWLIKEDLRRSKARDNPHAEDTEVTRY